MSFWSAFNPISILGGALGFVLGGPLGAAAGYGLGQAGSMGNNPPPAAAPPIMPTAPTSETTIDKSLKSESDALQNMKRRRRRSSNSMSMFTSEGDTLYNTLGGV